MTYKAVLFDLDDTLLKTWIVKWAHHKAVAKQFYNIDLSDEVLAKHWGMPFKPMMALLYQNADTLENMLKANLSLEDEFPKGLQEDALDVVNALLKAGVLVGVVTSIVSGLAREDLRRNGFSVDDFLLVQGSDDTSAHKPDPRVFDPPLALLRKKHIAPSEVIYVGDALMDYYAARDAGVAFAGVTTGRTTKQQFAREGAPAVGSLSELLDRYLVTASRAPLTINS